MSIIAIAKQDVGAMWEADAAAQWERENAMTEDEEKLMASAYDLNKAYGLIDDAMDALADAIHKVEGTFAEDKLTSILNDLENLNCDLKGMKRDFSKGVF